MIKRIKESQEHQFMQANGNVGEGGIPFNYDNPDVIVSCIFILINVSLFASNLVILILTKNPQV